MFLMLTIAGGILIAVAILVVVAIVAGLVAANWEDCAGWFGAAFVLLLLWAASYVGRGLVWFLILFCVAVFVAGMVEAAGSVAEAMTILRRMVRRG